MGESPILVIFRDSPVVRRTLGVAQSICRQWPLDVARVVLLSPRAVQPGLGRDTSRVEVIPADEDWLGQILDIVRKAGCRWVVLPSYLDQYLPGAFEAVLSAPVEEGRSVVGPCYIRVDGQRQLVGPQPFCFDYYAVLFQTNYIAPAAVFLDARAFVTTGGLDARFPTAGVWEYLLRVGAGDGVVALDHPLVETEAKPFLGIPGEYATRYAVEAAAIALQYNQAGFTPGATLGLAAVIGAHLDGLPSFAGYDSPLLHLSRKLKRDFEEVLLRSLLRTGGRDEAENLSRQKAPTWRDEASTLAHVVILFVKGVVFAPVSNFAERYRNASLAFTKHDHVIPSPISRRRWANAIRLVKPVVPVPVWNFGRRCRNSLVAFTQTPPSSASARFRTEMWDEVISRVKRVTPIPVRTFLKRCRNAWVAFRRPVL